jgi:hypothetical protein
MNHLTVKNKLVRLAQEYYDLGLLSQLSDSQQNRLLEILELAESDQQLSQMLSQIDSKLAKELHLLEQDSLDEYERQRTKLSQF